MPIPSRKKDEQREEFMSRCMSEMSHKDPQMTPEQRAAICHQKAEAEFLNEMELAAIARLIGLLNE